MGGWYGVGGGYRVGVGGWCRMGWVFGTGLGCMVL